jgi:Raf kinase inhibitor-like YbhB/YbcL family protein
MTLRVTSPAFGPGERIPARHTGEGEDVSPALAWDGVPEGTKEICLICEDPDAPRPQPWVHWLVAGLPGSARGLEEGAAKGHVAGMTDFGESGWGGPMPPRGHGVHRYVFRVYAHGRPSGLHSRFSKADMLAAIKGHVLDQGELIGTYERP